LLGDWPAYWGTFPLALLVDKLTNPNLALATGIGFILSMGGYTAEQIYNAVRIGKK